MFNIQIFYRRQIFLLRLQNDGVLQVLLQAATNGKISNRENVVFKQRKKPFQLKSQKHISPVFLDYSLTCSVSGRFHEKKGPIFRHFVQQMGPLFSHDPTVQLDICWKLLSEVRKSYFRDPNFKYFPGGMSPDPLPVGSPATGLPIDFLLLRPCIFITKLVETPKRCQKTQ